MMVLCILLAMLSLFLSLKLIYQRKLVQKVKKQIDFLKSILYSIFSGCATDA